MFNNFNELNTDLVIYILDIIGVVAASAAASMLAKRVGLDVIGAIMVALVGSIGGGTARDLLLDRHPIFWLHQLSYLYVVIIVTVIVQIFYFAFEKLNKPLRLFDAIGLAAFSVIGFNAALSKGMSDPIIILMGVITAVIGGIVRDIICDQIPLVLREEIYISASIVGGLFYLLLVAADTPIFIREYGTMLVVFTVRMLAIYRGWNLPSLTIQPRRKD